MKKIFTFLVCLSAPALIAQGPPNMKKPGVHHEHLRMMVGEWNVKSIIHTIPGRIIEMKGVEVAKMQPGGFWLITDFSSKFMGMPFKRHAVIGYEAHKKKYIGTWIDSFGSTLITSTGICSKNGKVTTMIGKGYDPVRKCETTYKQVYEIKDANNRTYHMYDVRGKNELLILEAAYKRQVVDLGLNTPPKGSFTHEIDGPLAAAYYLGGPQQARPPEGRFKPGTRVRLVRNAGSYCVVESENGITAYVATDALKPMKRK